MVDRTIQPRIASLTETIGTLQSTKTSPRRLRKHKPASDRSFEQSGKEPTVSIPLPDPRRAQQRTPPPQPPPPLRDPLEPDPWEALHLPPNPRDPGQLLHPWTTTMTAPRSDRFSQNSSQEVSEREISSEATTFSSVAGDQTIPAMSEFTLPYSNILTPPEMLALDEVANLATFGIGSLPQAGHYGV